MRMFGLVIVLGGFLAVVFSVTVAGVRVSSRDIAWIAGTPHTSPAEAAVYTRYLERHRRHRLAGGLFGALFAVAVGIRWYGAVTIGIGEGNPFADVLFCAVAGVIVGALSAETYRLSEPQSTTVATSLAERQVEVPGSVVPIARGAVAVSLIIGLAVAMTGNGSAALLIALAGAMLAAVSELTRRAIAGRRRPLLSPGAQIVDGRMRSFAGASVAMLQAAGAALTAGWTLSEVPLGDAGFLLTLRFLAVVGCLVWAVALLMRAAPRPRRSWVVEPAA